MSPRTELAERLVGVDLTEEYRTLRISAFRQHSEQVAREVGLPATPTGKTGRVTLPLIARDATPSVLVTSDDIAGALDAEDVERFASQ